MGNIREKPKAARKKKKFSAGKLFAFCGVAAALAIVCATIGYMVIIYNGQKILDENKDKMVMAEASVLYDANDQEVAILARENREIVESKDIPDKLRKAFIATEDRRFEEHAGVDFWAIGRAIVKDIVARSKVEGGSTITQQLAKNMFLDADKTFFRKATEASIALALEGNYSKDEILTMYLNRIYFGKGANGKGAYGVKAAAKAYFGKSDLNQLELWEMATLAAIPKAPSYYSPVANPEKSKERRGVVLKLMYDQGYISEQEKNEAQDVEYVAPPQNSNNKELLTYRDYVLKEAAEVYGIEEEQLLRGGYKIKTTMDANAQRIMEQAFENEKLFLKDGPSQKMQGAMVIVNHKDGGIVAMIGGRDYVNKGLNRALVQRQPGSAFKPIVVYAPAIEKDPVKWNPYTLLKDEEHDYSGYSPRNWDGQYRGQVNMFDAVRQSINAPAVWLLNEIKVDTGFAFAKKLGFTLDEKNDHNLAIALGGLTKGVTPLQMAQAYGAFANGGYLNTSHAIREIIDGNDRKVASFKPERTKVMSPKTAYYMTELLKSVVEPGGLGTAAKLNRPTAGKTGTTQLDLKGLEKYNRDIWFAGYTPEWAAAVWMGFDKTDAKHYVTGGGGQAAAMFKEVMQKALANVPVTQFVKPEGVSDLKEPPKSVTNLTAEYVKEGSPKVKLVWTTDSNEFAEYQIYRKEANETEFKLLASGVKNASQFNDITVYPGESYQYYMVPYNSQSGATGEKSNTVAVNVPADSGSPLPGVSPGASPAAKPGALPGDSGRSGDNGNVRSPKPSGSPGASPTPAPPPAASGKPAPSGSPLPSLPAADQPAAGKGKSGTGDAKPAETAKPSDSARSADSER